MMSHGASEKVCGLCGARNDQLKTCRKCQSAWYCNKEHQTEHWTQHQPFCNIKSRAMAAGGGGAGSGGTSAKSRKKEKKKQETNFNIDTAALDEVAQTHQRQYREQTYDRYHQDQAAAIDHNELQFQGWGGQGRGRRNSPVQDLSTPIDSSHHPLEASSHVCQSRSPPLYHVTDSVDSQSLEEGGFNQEWFSAVLKLIIKDLNQYGVCVVDEFLGEWLLFVYLMCGLCMCV